MRINLEIIRCKIELDKIYYSIEKVDCTNTSSDPDGMVLGIVKKGGVLENFIIHSTSWRYENPDLVTLTYIVYIENYSSLVDVTQTKTLSVSAMEIAFSKSHDTPRPNQIEEQHVVSHGIRHFSLLLKLGDKEQFKRVLSEKEINMLENLSPTLSGEYNAVP